MSSWIQDVFIIKFINKHQKNQHYNKYHISNKKSGVYSAFYSVVGDD